MKKKKKKKAKKVLKKAVVKKQPKKRDKKYRATLKFNRWARLVLDRNNKKTFGNATQSVILAYGLDPKKQYASAATIGKENIKKLQHFASAYAEKKGLGYGQMIDIAVFKMMEHKDPDWWDRLMQLFGYIDSKKYPTVVQATQVNVGDAVSGWLKKAQEAAEEENNG